MLRRIIKSISKRRSWFEIRGEIMISRKTNNTQIIDTAKEKLNRIGAMLTFNNSRIVAPI